MYSSGSRVCLDRGAYEASHEEKPEGGEYVCSLALIRNVTDAGPPAPATVAHGATTSFKLVNVAPVPADGFPVYVLFLPIHINRDPLDGVKSSAKPRISPDVYVGSPVVLALGAHIEPFPPHVQKEEFAAVEGAPAKVAAELTF